MNSHISSKIGEKSDIFIMFNNCMNWVIGDLSVFEIFNNKKGNLSSYNTEQECTC